MGHICDQISVHYGSRFVPFGANLIYFGAKLDIPVSVTLSPVHNSPHKPINPQLLTPTPITLLFHDPPTLMLIYCLAHSHALDLTRGSEFRPNPRAQGETSGRGPRSAAQHGQTIRKTH